MRVVLAVAFACVAGSAWAQGVPSKNLCAEVKGTGGVTMVCTDVARGKGLTLVNRAVPPRAVVANPRTLVVCPATRSPADTAVQTGSGYVVRTDVVTPLDCN